MDRKRKAELERQAYRVVGSHSAIKVCMWTKQAIRCFDLCYKNTFYGIKSHRCVQMTPALPFCTHRCVWCWRDIEWTSKKWKGKIDSPKFIVDSCIKEHLPMLFGFKGNKKVDKKVLSEALKPIHFAISLSGEPTLYPKLPELINELKKRKITSFLVTNGTNPNMLKKLINKKIYPTQLYITLPAPDEELYKKVCNPLIKDSWKKINESLILLKKFPRSTVRLTLARHLNLTNPEGYAELIKKANPEFLEVKGYVWVGYSRKRLEKQNMPFHTEIKDFSKKLSKLTGYKIVDEKQNSRVVLLMKKDSKKRIMAFD